MIGSNANDGTTLSAGANMTVPEYVSSSGTGSGMTLNRSCEIPRKLDCRSPGPPCAES